MVEINRQEIVKHGGEEKVTKKNVIIIYLLENVVMIITPAAILPHSNYLFKNGLKDIFFYHFYLHYFTSPSFILKIEYTVSH